MKHVSVLAVLSVLLLITFSTYTNAQFNEDIRDEVVGLFGTLLAPSIFSTAHTDPLTISLYGRTLTSEGEVPDFDGDIRDSIDEMTIYAGVRLNDLGLTLGFGQGSAFEFSQPIILSVDYKHDLMPRYSMGSAAIDLQYSMIALPDEKNIKVSALGFGVVSVNGLVSMSMKLIPLEPYAGLTLNYVYLNSDTEGNIQVLKWIPKIGLRVTALPLISASTELMFIKNKHLDSSAWMWNLGVSVRL